MPRSGCTQDSKHARSHHRTPYEWTTRGVSIQLNSVFYSYEPERFHVRLWDRRSPRRFSRISIHCAATNSGGNHYRDGPGWHGNRDKPAGGELIRLPNRDYVISNTMIGMTVAGILRWIVAAVAILTIVGWGRMSTISVRWRRRAARRRSSIRRRAALQITFAGT